jgi:hypothetical protein
MQYLVVSFLRWVVTSCATWGSLSCLSTPSCAANFPLVDLREAVVHRVHPAPRARQARVAHQVHRVQAAHPDRAEAVVVPPVPVPEADRAEAPVPPVKAGVQEPAGTQEAVGPLDRADLQVALAHLDQAVRQVAPVHRVVQARRVARDLQARAADHRVDPQVRLVHPAAVLPLVDRRADLPAVPGRKAAQAQAAHPVPSHRGAAVRAVVGHPVADPRAVVRQVVAHRETPDHQDLRAPVAQVDPAARRDRNLRGAVDRVAADRKVVQAVNRVQDLVPSLALNPVRKAAASLQAQDLDHRDQVVVVQVQAVPVLADQDPAASLPGAATVAVRDPGQDRAVVRVQVPVRVPLVLVPAESVAQGNPTDRVATVVAPRVAVAVLVQQVVAVARATTNGTDSVGRLLGCPIRALLRWDPFKRSVSALETSQRVPAHTWAKLSTQDARKVWHE